MDSAPSPEEEDPDPIRVLVAKALARAGRSSITIGELVEFCKGERR
jgi:hypothetical protein